jgi:phospholipase C
MPMELTLCTNSNLEDNGSTVNAFHDSNYCPGPDLDHSCPSAHLEGNFENPNNMLKSSPTDGFVAVNDKTEQTDASESATEDDTIGFYNESDLPFHYSLAQTFAIDDQYFCDVVGPTVPNRFYLMAATSFGHLTTNELSPPPPSFTYKRITGTIVDLLDKAGVSRVDYYSDVAQGADFRKPIPPHCLTATPNVFADAAAATCRRSRSSIRCCSQASVLHSRQTNIRRMIFVPANFGSRR